MKEQIKNILPVWALKWLRPLYHGVMAYWASLMQGRPSRQLIVIGVTGTSGKSTTVGMISHILNFAGIKAGHITTANYFDGTTEHTNKHGLSMPAGPLLQKQLKRILKNGCKVAVVECTSEGLAQNRHRGIDFDIALITNLERAHLDSHGGFGKYRAAKGKLFSALGSSSKKFFFMKKVLGVNIDDAEHKYYLQFPADEKFGISTQSAHEPEGMRLFFASTIQQQPTVSFTVEKENFSLNAIGMFSVYNALMATACVSYLDVEPKVSAKALAEFQGMPGRLEKIENNLGITIIVDYAPEPLGMRSVLEAVNRLNPGKIIHVFGSTGGNRDKAKRFEFGEISAELADVIYVTNDDIYDSDPEEIANNIQQGIWQASKKRAQEVVKNLNRRGAIHQALLAARPGDVVLITGKGSEQFLVEPKNKRIPWDDRTVVREELGYIAMDHAKKAGSSKF